jgi:hypothetical protein
MLPYRFVTRLHDIAERGETRARGLERDADFALRARNELALARRNRLQVQRDV